MYSKKLLFSILSLALLGLVIFGLVLPYLFSAKSNEAVLLGAFIAFSILISVVFFINRVARRVPKRTGRKK